MSSALSATLLIAMTLACVGPLGAQPARSKPRAKVAAAKAPPKLTALQIVQRSVARDEQNYELLARYTYTTVSTDKRYKKDGSLDSSESKTHEVMMLAGSPYEKLVAEDGKPLSKKDAEKEQNKLDKELRKRQKDPKKERAEWEEERAKQREFLSELPNAFTFTLLGTEMLNGRPAWKIHAEPREDFEPQHSRADAFKKVRATLWVDQKDFQWARADLELIDTMSWGWFLLRLAPGGKITIDQKSLNDEVWLPTNINIRADARVALFKMIRAEINIDYRDYQRFETESQIVDIQSLSSPK